MRKEELGRVGLCLFRAGVGLAFSGVLGGCAAPPERALPTPISEDAPVVARRAAGGGTDADVAWVEQAWSEVTHVNLSALAAKRWGLPTTRVNVISDGADDPDEYEAGFDNGFNQQWSHAYIYSWFGFWIWGDANENFDDCITGTLAGQLEGPECKDGKSASFYYGQGDQRSGDRFLGYATHYVEDVSQVLHASQPDIDMLTHHFDYEDWVKNNWLDGYQLGLAVAADNYYYPVTDPQGTVRSAAWAASYWNGSSYGRTAWNAYRNAGYPTAPGSGSAELAASTTQLLIRASRYTTGALKYALDRYAQWSSQY
jgi:hypothetical protein